MFYVTNCYIQRCNNFIVIPEKASTKIVDLDSPEVEFLLKLNLINSKNFGSNVTLLSVNGLEYNKMEQF